MIYSAQNMEEFALVGLAALGIFGFILILYMYTLRNNRVSVLRIHTQEQDSTNMEDPNTETNARESICEEQAARLQNLEHKLRKSKQEFQKAKEELQKERQEKMEAFQRLHEQESKEQSYIASLHLKEEELGKEKKDHQETLQKLREQESKEQGYIASLNLKEKEHRKEKEDQLKNLQKQAGEMRGMEEELKSERAEKEDALRRLSAIMSSRLKDGNPNVVDLNDQNRPTKIGEKYSELYDNQWTDAYGALEASSHNAERIIYILRVILEQCFERCRSDASVQLDNFRQGIENIAGAIAMKSKTLTNDVMQRLKEERKVVAIDCRPNLESVLETVDHKFSGQFDDTDILKSEQMRAYLEECLTLCWYMAIQDPPMVIISETGENPHQLFRPYLTSGPYVKYVVWPSLLLNDQGAMVMKGTAEFTKQQLI